MHPQNEEDEVMNSAKAATPLLVPELTAPPQIYQVLTSLHPWGNGKCC